jgi:hypothetical protein
MSVENTSSTQPPLVGGANPHCRIVASTGHSPPCTELDLLHLSLLHQFSTSTYATFSSNRVGQAVWRDHVPRIAFSHPSVLHAIFAVSALHLSFLNPAKSSRYQLIAADNYQKASVSLRQALQSDSLVGAGRGGALFVASALIAVYVFADPAMRCAGEPGALTWIPIIRGIKTVLATCWEGLEESSIAPLLKIGAQPEPTPTPAENAQPPLELPADIDTLHLTEPDGAEAAIYAHAVEKLREALHFTRNNDFRIACTFVWPVTLLEGFMDLLRQKKPRALVLVASYYCAMSPILNGLWWSGTTPKRDMEIIEQMVGSREEAWAKLFWDSHLP